MTVQGGFSDDFSDEFETDDTYFVTVDVGVVDRTQRPKHPLWRRMPYPVTPVGLLLYTDGTVKATTTFEIDEWLEADDRILGGHVWYARNDSWQAQVLETAGYLLRRYEGPIL